MPATFPRGILSSFGKEPSWPCRSTSSRLEVTGQPVPAIANVMQALNITNSTLNTGAGQFSVSDSGWLVYASGGILPDMENSLVWVDQKGNAQPLLTSRLLFRPRLSLMGNGSPTTPLEENGRFGSMTSIAAQRAG